MTDRILLPVYYGRIPKAGEAFQPIIAPATTKVKLPSFVKKWLIPYPRPELGVAYFYRPFDDWRTDSDVNLDDERQPPALVVDNGSLKYEISKGDLEMIGRVKDRLSQRLSPILENYGLRFSYQMGGGPGEIPKGFSGIICWLLKEIQYEKTLTRNRNTSLFRVEAGASKTVFADTGKTIRNPPHVIFRVRLTGTAHHEFMKIPLAGIGAEFFLEELFAVLERSDFIGISVPNLNDRLNWFFGMIEKHQNVVFSPMPESLLESIFDSIRARAIKIEN